MKRLSAVLLVVAALSACVDDPSAPATPPDPTPALSMQDAGAERVVPGQVVVKVARDAVPSEVARGHGLEIAGRGHGNAFVVLRGAVGNERALAARLRTDARVEWAEPNYLRRPHAIDPRLWAFYNPGDLAVAFTRGRNKDQPVESYRSTEDADVDNEEGYASGGAAVLVGSIDSGVDMGHQEFAGVTVVAGQDWYDGDADPSDSDGHGTHTAGTMVGNTVGIAGVSGGNVGVHVQRVCGPIGCPLSAIASAIRAATDGGVVAMNLSLGGPSLSEGEAEAIDYATSHGVLVVASAGNGGTGTVSCPACDPDAISVAATNWQDQLSYYSSWGPGLDLSAPGGELYSNTTEEAGIYSSVPGGYAYYQGTSMAAPQVTGTAGIVASVTGLRGSALRARLEDTVDDLGAGGYDQTFGHGRLNAHRAVTGSGGDGGGGGEDPPPPSLDAAFSYSCSKDTCLFDASGSTGANSWDWAFGDGGTASSETASHTYGGTGSYAVVLTVGDGSGGTDTAEATVSCSVRGKNLHCR